MKILGGLFMFIGAGVIIYIRIANIDMTEMRLFINYYHFYAFAVGILLCGYGLFTKEDK